MKKFNLKQLFCVLLTVCMVIGAMPLVALAETASNAGIVNSSCWDGKYPEEDTDFGESEDVYGKGLDNDPYLIVNAAQLAQLAVNSQNTNYEGVYFSLVSSLDLCGFEWSVTIGSQNNPFKGVFKGNSNSIDGFYGNVDATPFGLFSQINGEVRDLNLSGTIDVNYDGNEGSIGGIAGIADGSIISNCSVSLKINAFVGNKANIGGIAGTVKNNTSITNCISGGKINVTATQNDNDSKVINVGGIAGAFYAMNHINNCSSACIIDFNTMTADIISIGGISGEAQDIVIYSCAFSGKITMKLQSNDIDANVGGIFGIGIKVTNEKELEFTGNIDIVCKNNGGTVVAGGLFGKLNDSIIINNIISDGSLSVLTQEKAYAGGIAGSVENKDKTTNITNVSSRCDITARGKELFAGQLFGTTKNTNTVNCLCAGELNVQVVGYDGSAIGAVCGWALESSFENIESVTVFENYEFKKSDSTFVGGIIGIIEDSEISKFLYKQVNEEDWIETDSIEPIAGIFNSNVNDFVFFGEAPGTLAEKVVGTTDLLTALNAQLVSLSDMTDSIKPSVWIADDEQNPKNGGYPVLDVKFITQSEAVDTSWYNPRLSVYEIKNYAQFKGLSQISRNDLFKGKTIKLTDDISIEADFDTIRAFSGTFDGNGHSITVKAGSVENYVFNDLVEAVVKNLTVNIVYAYDGVNPSTEYFSNFIKSTVFTVYRDINIDFACNYNVMNYNADSLIIFPAIVVMNACEIYNCSTSGNISYNNTNERLDNSDCNATIGVFTGASNNSKYNDCTFATDVNVNSKNLQLENIVVNGFAQNSNDDQFANVEFNSDISVNSQIKNSCRVSCGADILNSIEFTNGITANGNITLEICNSFGYPIKIKTGGIASEIIGNRFEGFVNNGNTSIKGVHLINNNGNTNDVKFATNRNSIEVLSGGICSNVNSKYVTGAVNNGNISVENCDKINVGGLFSQSLYLTLDQCVNTGNISIVNNNTSNFGIISGGITALSIGNIVNCSNSGDIQVVTEAATNGLPNRKFDYSTGSNTGIIIGGIIAKETTGESISNCFVTGNLSIEQIGLTTYNTVGGILAAGDYSGSIDNCYFAGNISCTGFDSSYSGSITGVTAKELLNCYYEYDENIDIYGTPDSIFAYNWEMNESDLLNDRIFVQNCTSFSGSEHKLKRPIYSSYDLCTALNCFVGEYNEKISEINLLRFTVDENVNGGYPCFATYWSDAGNYDISWFKNGSQKTFYIETAQQLAGFMALYKINQDYSQDLFLDKTIIIKNDIDMSAHIFSTIAEDKTKPFNGTFDGNGKTITGINIISQKEAVGFFGYTESAVIKNLTIKGNINYSQSNDNWKESHIGALVARGINTTFEFVNTDFDLNIAYKNGYNETKLGGLVGYSEGCTTKCCNINGNIVTDINMGANEIKIGGIAGVFFNGNIDGSTFNGNIILRKHDQYGTMDEVPSIYVGGIVGLTWNANVTTVEANGTIDVDADNARLNIGGIIGMLDSVYVKGATNNADILYNASVNAIVGGVFGGSIYSSIIGVLNTGDITGSAIGTRVAGVLSQASENATVNDLQNRGNITLNLSPVPNAYGNEVSGVVGGDIMLIDGAENYGDINITSAGDGRYHIGGIYANSTLENTIIINSMNFGDITYEMDQCSRENSVFAGGINGANNGGKIFNCLNTGNVSVTINSGDGLAEVFAGGLVGFGNADIKNGVNLSSVVTSLNSIKSKACAGLIIGSASDEVRMFNVFFKKQAQGASAIYNGNVLIDETYEVYGSAPGYTRVCDTISPFNKYLAVPTTLLLERLNNNVSDNNLFGLENAMLKKWVCVEDSNNGYPVIGDSWSDWEQVDFDIALNAVKNRVEGKTTTIVSTPEQLAQVLFSMQAGDSFSEKTIIINNDIDLTGHGFTPIPCFEGIMTGIYHTISGLDIYSPQGNTAFVNVNNGMIKSLTLEGKIVSESRGNSGVAAFAKENNGVIFDSTSKVEITGAAAAADIIQVGSITAINNGIVYDCVNYGAIDFYCMEAKNENAVAYIGGIVGSNLNQVYNNLNAASHNANIIDERYTVYIAGIVGLNSNEIENCVNLGMLKAGQMNNEDDIKAYKGSIVAYNTNEVNNCFYKTGVGYTSNYNGKSEDLAKSAYIATFTDTQGNLSEIVAGKAPLKETLIEALNDCAIAKRYSKWSVFEGLNDGYPLPGENVEVVFENTQYKFVNVNDNRAVFKIVGSYNFNSLLVSGSEDDFDTTEIENFDRVEATDNTINVVFTEQPDKATDIYITIFIKNAVKKVYKLTVIPVERAEAPNVKYDADAKMLTGVRKGTLISTDGGETWTEYVSYDGNLNLKNLQMNDGDGILLKTPATDKLRESEIIQIGGYVDGKDYVLGDVNGDEKVDAIDALFSLQASVGKFTLTEAQQKAVDVNFDGAFNSQDALLILQYSVNLITEF